jgi:hypothetical protein
MLKPWAGIAKRQPQSKTYSDSHGRIPLIGLVLLINLLLVVMAYFEFVNVFGCMMLDPSPSSSEDEVKVRNTQEIGRSRSVFLHYILHGLGSAGQLQTQAD